MKRILLVILFLVMAVPVMAAKVHVDHDRQANFSQYKTYALGQGTPAGSEITQKKIEAAVRSQLEAEGLTAADKGKADLLVQIHAVTDKELKQTGSNVNVGLSKRGKRGSVGVSSGGRRGVKEVKTGNLIIDLVDRAKDELVWQARASDTLKGDAQKMEQKLQKAIEEAFAKYPPE